MQALIYYVAYQNFQYRVIAAVEDHGGRVAHRTVAVYQNHAEAVGHAMLLRTRRSHQPAEEYGQAEKV